MRDYKCEETEHKVFCSVHKLSAGADVQLLVDFFQAEFCGFKLLEEIRVTPGSYET